MCSIVHAHSYFCLEEPLGLKKSDYHNNRRKVLTYFDPEDEFRPGLWSLVGTEPMEGRCVCSHKINWAHEVQAFGHCVILGSSCIHRLEVDDLTKAVDAIDLNRGRRDRKEKGLANGKVYCVVCDKMLGKTCVDLVANKKRPTTTIGRDRLTHVKCAEKCKKCRSYYTDDYQCNCRRCLDCDDVIEGPRWKVRCISCYRSAKKTRR